MLKFVIGVEQYRMSGSAVERALWDTWDRADFDVVSTNEETNLLFGPPLQIQYQARHIAQELIKTQDAAFFYVGMARGYDYRSLVFTPTSFRAISICFDFAVVYDRFGKQIRSQCLNKEQVHQRAKGERPMIHDDSETLEELVALVGAVCEHTIMVD